MRRLHRFLGCGIGLALALASVAAFANSGGVPGYTGKPNATAPQGESCNKCHTGGTAPRVTVTGPDTLAAGQSAEYSLVVSTDAGRAAAGIAATNGVKLANVSGLVDSFDELVQDGPMNVNAGQATFTFRVTAPLSGTTLKLWAVGLAAGGAGSTGGDRAAHTTKDISVTGGSSSSGGTDDDASDPGTGSSGNASPTGGSTKTPATPGTAAANDGDGALGEDESDAQNRSRLRSSTVPPAACAAAPQAMQTTGDAVMVAVSAILLLVTLRRRRVV